MKKMVAGGNIVTEYSYDTDRNLVNQKTYVKNSWEHGQRESLTALSASKVCDFDAIRTAPGNQMGIRNLSLGQMYGNARVIVDDTYQYDPLGNMTSKKTLSGLSQYSYDAIERMTKVVSPRGVTEYTYDQAGNRITKTVMDIIGQNRKQEQYVYDSRNRMLERNLFAEVDHIFEKTQMYEYAYDEQGNMTAEKEHSIQNGQKELQGTKTFSFDALNRLQEVYAGRNPTKII